MRSTAPMHGASSACPHSLGRRLAAAPTPVYPPACAAWRRGRWTDAPLARHKLVLCTVDGSHRQTTRGTVYDPGRARAASRTDCAIVAITAAVFRRALLALIRLPRGARVMPGQRVAVMVELDLA
eukprot:1066206-Prymnesium_polylepis.1